MLRGDELSLLKMFLQPLHSAVSTLPSCGPAVMSVLLTSPSSCLLPLAWLEQKIYSSLSNQRLSSRHPPLNHSPLMTAVKGGPPPAHKSQPLVKIKALLSTQTSFEVLCGMKLDGEFRSNSIVWHCTHFTLTGLTCSHLSPRLCPFTAGCSPPSMSSIVFCLLFSCFTFHLGFVHPLQDVALHQCLLLSCLLLSCYTFHLGFVHPLQDVALHQCLPLSCLLLSCYTFHLGFVHPLQDVALHQCLPLSSVC